VKIRLPRVLRLALIFGSSTVAAVAAPTVIPLIQGLTVVGAASERQGDYESTYTIDGLDADGMLHLDTSAELPDPAGGKAKSVSFNRDVSANDREHARTYKYMFSTGPQEYPGTTALGTSAAVINDLRAAGRASITFDGQMGGLGNLLSGIMALIPDADAKKPADLYFTGSGTIRSVESKPVPYPMLVNDSLVSVSAWHVKGDFVQGEGSVPIEWYILDDPANPLTLRFAIGKDRVEVIRMSFPLDNPTKSLETSLARDHRAVIYGIYFDFNSATIKPQSATVLHTIADVMKKNIDWTLTVEGHTDNIGGSAANQDLSTRRAAAVRAALIQLGISETRLLASGFGASAPRDTNATLAGRARNRRVELTRQ
jgi:outer membrane protein OmpA-like peptidoglycan-associated protein